MPTNDSVQAAPGSDWVVQMAGGRQYQHSPGLSHWASVLLVAGGAEHPFSIVDAAYIGTVALIGPAIKGLVAETDFSAA